MKSIRTTLIAASLLAGLSGLALAQTNVQVPSSSPRAGHMDKMHAKMGARHAEHLTELKGKLNLQTSQEGTWNNFAQSMQKPERMARPDQASMEKMSTPQRLDRLQAIKVEKDAQMQKRINATKDFYASLSAEQQQIFDKETAQAMGRMGGGMHRMQHGSGHHSMH
jgi:protein CpxP